MRQAIMNCPAATTLPVDTSTCVREVELEDLSAVDALSREAGWGGITRDGWRRSWEDNPALCDGPRPRRGWVLNEPGHGVVGFLANLVQVYHLNGRRLRAATACSFFVRPAFRGKSLSLAMAFARQSNVELLLNTTATAVSAKLFEFLKFLPLPQPEYERSFYWPLRPMAFAVAALRKKGCPAGVSRLVGPPVAAMLYGDRLLRGRMPQARMSGVEIASIDAHGIDAAMEDLWHRQLSASGSTLLADRSAESLKWHFPVRKGTRILCARRGERVVGYLAVVRQDAAHVGLERARIADVFVERDDPSIIAALLTAAARAAHDDGAAMLEMVGFPERIRRVAAGFRPYVLTSEASPFLYRPVAPDLGSHLQQVDAWYAGPYDGDGSL